MKQAPNEKAPSGQAEGFGKNTTKRDRNFTERFTPRQRRLAAALATGRWVSREDVDSIAGTSNGPEIVRQLRRRVTGDDGLEMMLFDGFDRDGQPVKYGRYRFTPDGKGRAIRAGLLGPEHGERA